MPKSVQRKIIAHELLGRGFQVSMVETALHALKVALAERPDLIVASQEIEDFPGVELARVCTDIAATAPCRFILMTSHRATDPALAGLPASAALIGKGPHLFEGSRGALGGMGNVGGVRRAGKSLAVALCGPSTDGWPSG